MVPCVPVISTEVEEALRRGDPVVALESAVIAQGLPFPHNMEASRRQARAVRSAGAVPATVAIIRGRVRVGLMEEEVRQLAQGVAKASVRDLACLMARGAEGGTTVSASIAIAGLAGIHVFATGGIGGVHRHARESFDISADLHEIARQRVAVICSGVKNMLDIAATLEMLETLGVPVVGLETEEMPGFLARETGIPLEHSVPDPATAARLLQIHWDMLRRPSGVLLVHPVPKEHALDARMLQESTDRAIEQCAAAGIRGKHQTPFLLQRLQNLTAGRSLPSNIALLEQNALRAAQIAVALAGHPAQGASEGA